MRTTQLEAVVLAVAEAVEKIGARNDPSLTEVGADFLGSMTKIDNVLGLGRTALWNQSVAALRRLSSPEGARREVNLERLPCEAAWRIYSDLVNLSVPVTLIVHEEDIESLFENSYGRKSEGESMGRTVALGFENKVVQPFAGNTESGQGLHGIEVSGKTWFVTADHFTLRT